MVYNITIIYGGEILLNIFESVYQTFEMQTKAPENISLMLNNAHLVLEKLSGETTSQEKFLTMIQGNSFGGVDITDSSIKNNSDFIVNLWD